MKIRNRRVMSAMVLVVAWPVVVAIAEPIMPEKDPEVAGQRVKYLDSVANKHPRVLITASRIDQVKAFYNSPEGKPYHDFIEGRLRSCNVPGDRKMGPDWARAQNIGLFGLPQVAVHYLVTKDKASFDKGVAYLKWLAGQADWDDGGEPAIPDNPEEYAKVLANMMQFGPKGERNSCIASAFTMVGATLIWDWLYNDLDPAFREQFRQILWQHARAMYYGGHMERNPGGSYWHGAPNYNHRWYRTWGLALAALATGEGKPEEQWLLSEVEKELKFNVTWLPNDGSQHEGPGYGSSAGALGMAVQVSDDLTGTHYLDAPFFANAGPYIFQIATPGLNESFYFADCFDKATSFHPFFLKTAAAHKQLDVLDGIRHGLQVRFNSFGIRDYSWLAILADTPSAKGGDYHKAPTTAFFPDDGIMVVRDSWQDNGVGARFKCGPLGGYQANAWCKSSDSDKRKRPNVAHDHPDANAFTLFADGDYLAETDRYPVGKGTGKLSTGHNTILINGVGQAPQGRSEGEEWMQPGSGDLTEAARMLAYKDAGNVVVAEGEAGGSYLAYEHGGKNRPALDRFRRTFIWVKGKYVLVFDDIRASSPVDITWLIQGAKLEPVSKADGRYSLAKGSAKCEFQLVSDATLKSIVGVSTANNHGKLMNWQQLQATANGKTARFACVLDPWHKEAKVAFTSGGPGKGTIKVTGQGIDDTWQWTAGNSRFEAATWHGLCDGGHEVTVDAKTAVPPAP